MYSTHDSISILSTDQQGWLSDPATIFRSLQGIPYGDMSTSCTLTLSQFPPDPILFAQISTRRETVAVAETARRELIRMALELRNTFIVSRLVSYCSVLTSIVRNVRATRPTPTGTMMHLLAPPPTFNHRLYGACARFQRSDFDLRRLDLRKVIECLERRTMPHGSFEVRNGQLHVSSL